MTFPASRVGFAVHHARQGERVLMVVPEWDRIPQVLTMISHFRHLAGEQIIRANGVQGLRTPAGGWIRFATDTQVRRRQHHYDAHLVLVDIDVDWTDDLAEALKLCAAKIHGDDDRGGS